MHVPCRVRCGVDCVMHVHHLLRRRGVRCCSSFVVLSPLLVPRQLVSKHGQQTHAHGDEGDEDNEVSMAEVRERPECRTKEISFQVLLCSTSSSIPCTKEIISRSVAEMRVRSPAVRVVLLTAGAVISTDLPPVRRCCVNSTSTSNGWNRTRSRRWRWWASLTLTTSVCALPIASRCADSSVCVCVCVGGRMGGRCVCAGRCSRVSPASRMAPPTLLSFVAACMSPHGLVLTDRQGIDNESVQATVRRVVEHVVATTHTQGVRPAVPLVVYGL
jgi:hypothetical protein